MNWGSVLSVLDQPSVTLCFCFKHAFLSAGAARSLESLIQPGGLCGLLACAMPYPEDCLVRGETPHGC